ncbi:MAG TPA: hypothetical protein VF395_18465 [Polyangiaceae bacterium]
MAENRHAAVSGRDAEKGRLVLAAEDEANGHGVLLRENELDLVAHLRKGGVEGPRELFVTRAIPIGAFGKDDEPGP